jgi:catechol 2,3-dioxygenase-like lactoylglutathione lyase family enzyme
MLLKEITLKTKHISAVYNFYKDVLQLQVKQPGTTSMAIEAGETRLIFEAISNDTNPFYHFAFNIPSYKIEEALQWLQNRVKLTWIEDYKSYIAEFTNWHARSIYFSDPAGNVLEFIARRDLNDDPAEAFSAHQIRNVSEIGVVFPVSEFDKKANDLLQTFQLDYFTRQPPMQHFRAIGDDSGLLIVVPEHRNWYPTNIPGGIFPLALTFENKGTAYRLQF